MPLQIRRGTDGERAGIIFANGELVYVTDTNELYIGDGVTSGGNQIVGSGAGSLEDLSDIFIQSPLTTGQVLRYDGFNWSNQTLSIVEGLEDLSDVFIQDPLEQNQVLTYNGFTWINQAPNINLNLEDLNDVLIQSPLTTGQVLTYDGVNWANNDISFNLFNDPNPTLSSNLALNNFDVSGTGNITLKGYAFLSTESADQYSISVERNNDTINPTAINMRRSRGTNISPTSVQNGDRIGDLGFFAHEGTEYVRAGGIQAVVSGAPTAGIVPTDLRFLVRASTGTEIEPLTIRSIGTAYFKSSIRDIASIELQSSHNETTGSTLLLMRRNRGDITTPTALGVNDAIYGLTFQGYSGTGWRTAATIRGVVDDTVSSTTVPGRIEFITANSAGAFGIKMVLNKDGILEIDDIRGRNNSFVRFSEIPVLPTYADETAADSAIGGSGNRVNGMMYYDTALGKLRGVAGGVWVDLH